MKEKGVIFDIDGVILDSIAIWTHLGERYLFSLGIEAEDGLAETLFSMSMEQGAGYLSENYPVGVSPEKVKERLEEMIHDFYLYEVKAKSGALSLLKGFKDRGIRITAATSSPRALIERALARNGLLEYVERIFTNSEIGKSKHSPDIYDAAASYMQTLPEETYVFEDSLYALKTAAKAGYRTVGVFDVEGEIDQEGLKETAEIYLLDLNDWHWR